MPWPNRHRTSLAAALAGSIALAGCGGTPDRPHRAGADGAVKVGRPYQAGGRTWVPADDRHYDRTGLASWYGAAHRGLPTANGERFDPDGISAAHTTLPLPSYVAVTALDTGRTILVRINDRGPFVGGRIIDLSQGAARRLGIERSGVTRVRVRRVYPDERARAALLAGRLASPRSAMVAAPPMAAIPRLPATAARPSLSTTSPPAVPTFPPAVASPIRPTATPPAAAGAPFLDMGGFDDPDRADAFASAAGGVGPAAVVGIGAEWRVRIGPYADDAMARSALARAGAAGYHDAHIVRESDRSQEAR